MYIYIYISPSSPLICSFLHSACLSPSFLACSLLGYRVAWPEASSHIAHLALITMPKSRFRATSPLRHQLLIGAAVFQRFMFQGFTAVSWQTEPLATPHPMLFITTQPSIRAQQCNAPFISRENALLVALIHTLIVADTFLPLPSFQHGNMQHAQSKESACNGGKKKYAMIH